MTYELINPVLIGSFPIKYKENSPENAAKVFWNEFSKLIQNEIPKMYFTLRNNDGKLFHFKVSEEESNKSIADFNITPVERVHAKADEVLINAYNELTTKKGGGRFKHYDDSSSSSDDSDESTSEMIEKFQRLNRLRKLPIMYYYYIPYAYGSDSVFMPSFRYPYIPHFFEIGFSTAFWG